MISTPRAMTLAELERQALPNQASKTFVVLDTAPILWQAQINQTFSNYERILILTFNNASGNPADVLEDHTLYVGSSAGAWDVAILRVRGSISGAELPIGETSNVLFASGQYLTVVDDFQIWAKPRTKGYSDSSIAYSDQHENFAPVVICDPDMVFFEDAASPLEITFSAAKSWCLSAGSKSYSWSFPGASSTADTTTSAPTATYNAAGRYRFACTVTVGGKSTVKYGFVHYIGAGYNPILDVEIGSSAPGTAQDGHEFEFETWDMSGYQPYARCYLVSRDYYGGSEQYLAYSAKHARVKIAGRVVRDDGANNPSRTSGFLIQVVGPAWILGKISASGRMYKNVTAAPATWDEYQNMTLDQCLLDVIRWQTNITTCLNVFRSEDVHICPTFAIGQDQIIEQLRDIGKRLPAEPQFDAFGDMYFQMPINMIPEAERGDLPVFMELNAENWHDEIESEIRVAGTSQVLVTGISVSTSSKKTYYYAIAGGRTLDRYGSARGSLEFLVSNQAEANEKAALALSMANPGFDFVIHLAANNWMIHPAYRGYIQATIQHNDETIYSGRLVLEEVETIIENGYMLMDWHCTPETIPGPAVKGDTPYSPTPPSPIPPAPIPPIPGTNPPGPNPAPGTLPEKIVKLTAIGVLYTENANDDEPFWSGMNSGLEGYSLSSLYVTQAGALWIFGVGFGGTSLLYAPFLGSQWYEIVNQAWLDENADGFIKGFGVNYYTGAVIFTTDSRYVFFGNQNGFARQPQQPITRFFYSEMTYGGGKWRWPGESSGASTLMLLSSDGSSVDSIGVLSYTSAPGRSVVPGGTSYLYMQSNTDYMLRIDGNDYTTETLLTSTGAPRNVPIHRNGFSADGSMILANDPSNQPKISTDYGATWSDVPNLTLGVYQFAVIDELCWIAIKTTVVNRLEMKVTTDAGATWIDRTGNLDEFADAVYGIYIRWWA
jgi:hypothetical protein